MTSPDAYALALIEAAALASLGATGFFQHGTALQNSLSSDEQTPQVFCFDPTPTQDSQASPIVKFPVTMSFLDVEPGDGDNPAVGEATILRMTALKDRFLALLDRNPLLEIESMVWESTRLIYGGRFTGVVLKFQLKLPRPVGTAACAVV